jgi:SNF2 family DNA or RNA helicase
LSASFYTKTENLPLLAKLYILKRTKKQVGIQIPDAVIDKNIVEWKNKREKDLSEEIHSALGFSNISFKGKNNDLVRMLGDKGVLPLLLRARQSCILPKLLAPVVAQLVKYGIIGGIDNYKEALQCSSKLDSVVCKILENKDNGNGKIVFCHFREEIDMIAQRLREGGIGKIAIFDGRFKGRDILNDKNDVLILQIQTGCEGLNLQENYNEIYFVSPHWNPAVEEQAIARCHRIGQKKIVVVNRFEMDGFIKDTKNVDNYVGGVQDYKKMIVSEIIKE